MFLYRNKEQNWATNDKMYTGFNVWALYICVQLGAAANTHTTKDWASKEERKKIKRYK